MAILMIIAVAFVHVALAQDYGGAKMVHVYECVPSGLNESLTVKAALSLLSIGKVNNIPYHGLLRTFLPLNVSFADIKRSHPEIKMCNETKPVDFYYSRTNATCIGIDQVYNLITNKTKILLVTVNGTTEVDRQEINILQYYTALMTDGIIGEKQIQAYYYMLWYLADYPGKCSNVSVGGLNSHIRIGLRNFYGHEVLLKTRRPMIITTVPTNTTTHVNKDIINDRADPSIIAGAVMGALVISALVSALIMCVIKERKIMKEAREKKRIEAEKNARIEISVIEEHL